MNINSNIPHSGQAFASSGNAAVTASVSTKVGPLIAAFTLKCPQRTELRPPFKNARKAEWIGLGKAVHRPKPDARSDGEFASVDLTGSNRKLPRFRDRREV